MFDMIFFYYGNHFLANAYELLFEIFDFALKAHHFESYYLKKFTAPIYDRCLKITKWLLKFWLYGVTVAATFAMGLAFILDVVISHSEWPMSLPYHIVKLPPRDLTSCILNNLLQLFFAIIFSTYMIVCASMLTVIVMYTVFHNKAATELVKARPEMEDVSFKDWIKMFLHIFVENRK